MSLQVIINGIATGSIYALIATGFALIFNVLKFSNFSPWCHYDSGSIYRLLSGFQQGDGAGSHPC